jgi:hypothetical protein
MDISYDEDYEELLQPNHPHYSFSTASTSVDLRESDFHLFLLNLLTKRKQILIFIFLEIELRNFASIN